MNAGSHLCIWRTVYSVFHAWNYKLVCVCVWDRVNAHARASIEDVEGVKSNMLSLTEYTVFPGYEFWEL